MAAFAMSDVAGIPEFFAERSVFITGATGFMGKVLTEKLLRSCPEVKAIYLLIRSKKGKTGAERLDDITHSELFSKLRTEQPEFRRKLVAVDGDMLCDDLGLDEATTTRLIEDVSVVFHSAATVRFTEEMKSAVEMNVRGVKRLLALCKQMRRLEALVHISTAYANCDRQFIDEKVYSPPIHHDELLKEVDRLDEATLKALTPKMIGARPNTYTYTKAVAESLVNEEAGSLPVAIVRPSIVGAAYREPVRGWVDNVNGPTGVLAGASKGIFRMLFADRNAIGDMMPVDMVTNLIITVAWHTATRRVNKVQVYNCTTEPTNDVSWGYLADLYRAAVYENPVYAAIRVPVFRLTKSVLWYKLNMIVDHMLPAYLMDLGLWLCGRGKMFVKIQERLQNGAASLGFFTLRSWTFSNTNTLRLLDTMTAHDRKVFPFQPGLIHWPSYAESYCLGVKQFILKDMSKLPKARRNLTRLRRLNLVISVLGFVLVWRVLARLAPVARLLRKLTSWLLVWLLRNVPGFPKSC